MILSVTQSPPASSCAWPRVRFFSLLFSSLLLLCALHVAAVASPVETEAIPSPSASAMEQFNQWLDLHRGAAQVGIEAADLARGVVLARERAREMRALLETNPQEFCRRSLPESTRASLPPQVQQLVEKRVKARGSFSVHCIFPQPGDHGPAGSHQHPAEYAFEATIKDQRYQAFVFGKWKDQATVSDAEIDGLVLGDAIVLGDSPTPVEQANAGEPVSAYVPTRTGPNTVLFIIARFSDQSTDPISDDTALSHLGGVSTFWQNNSGGLVSLRGLANPGQVADVVHITLPQPSSYGATYNNNFSQLLNDARTAAAALGYNYTSYNLDVVVTSNSGFSYAGRSMIGAQGCHLVAGYTSLRTAGHELGHNLGLYHANYWRTDSTDPFGKDTNPGGYASDAANSERVEYGHYFSLMSAQYGGEIDDPTKPHYAPNEKAFLGWLSGSEVQYVASSGTYRLYKHDHRDTVGTPRGIRIETPATDYTGYSRRYWLGYRYAPWSTAQNWFRNGLQVDVAQSGYGSDGAIMLDMTPFSLDAASPFYDPNNKPGSWWTIDQNDKLDGALVVGRTYDDVSAGIHITPIATGSSGLNEEYIDMVINLGTFPGNRTPEIPTFDATANQVAPNQSITFAVSAIDPDGDTLAYAWDFDEVQVWNSSGLNSPTAAKSWSTPGQYRVMVTVSDMKGGVVTVSQIITVGSPVNTNQIWGRVLWAGQGVDGARVWTTVGSTVFQAWTQSDGSYVLTDLSSTNSYTVNCVKGGLTFTRQFSNPVSVASGNASGKDFYANEPLGAGGTTYALSGQVLDPITGVSGVEIRAGGMATFTDSSGNYQLSNLVNGTYTVVPKSPNWTFTPANRSVTINSANSSGNNFSRAAPYSISGSFSGIPAGNQDPSPNVFSSNGRAVTCTRGGTGGSRYWVYTINNMPAGQYSVSAESYGYSIVPSGFSNPLTVSGNLSGINFAGAASGVLGAIRGRILRYGLPLTGATVDARQGSTTIASAFTDTDGYYRLENLPEGNITIVPSLTGCAFSPSSSSLSVSFIPGPAQNFTATGPTAAPSISSVTATPSVLSSAAGTTVLSVTASGGAPFTYSWDATNAAGPVTFSANDSTAASSTAVGFQVPGRYTFRVRVTDTNGFPSTTTVTVTVSAGANAMAVSPYEVQAVANSSVAFRADAWDQLGNKITVSPVWSVDGGGTINSTGLFSAMIPGGPYIVRAVADSLTATASVWVLPGEEATPPVITSQPQAQTVAAGSNVTFTVTAGGSAPLSYQWLFNGAPITGATSHTYLLPNAQIADSGTYSVQVTNVVGLALSSNAVLRVLPVLTISALNTNKLYGAPLPALTPLYAGFINGDTPASLDSPPGLTTPATAESPVGTYPVLLEGAADADYIIVPVPGTLAITPAHTTGLLTSSTNPVPSAQPVAFTLALSAVAPGAGLPGGTVQFQFDGTNAGVPVPLNEGVATLTTDTLTHGIHSVSAAYAGDANFIGVTNVLLPYQLINSAPVATADTLERDLTNNMLEISIATLLSNDIDVDGDLLQLLSFAEVTANGGTVVSNENRLFYSPVPGPTNADTFSYTISDSFGASATGTVTIEVRVDLGPPPKLAITLLGDGVYQIRGEGTPGVTYRLLTTDDLERAAWQTLGTVTADLSGRFELTDRSGSGPRFYRAVSP